MKAHIIISAWIPLLRVKSRIRKIDDVKETRYIECEYLESRE